MTVSARDRGESSSEFAAVSTVLFALVFCVVHAAALWMGAQFATTVAAQGALMASVVDERAGVVRVLDAVETTARELGVTLDRAPRVVSSGDAVSVTVSLRIPRIVPFMASSVTRTVTRAREQFMTEDER